MKQLKEIGVAILGILTVLVLIAGAYAIYMLAIAIFLGIVGLIAYKLGQVGAKWK